MHTCLHVHTHTPPYPHSPPLQQVSLSWGSSMGELIKATMVREEVGQKQARAVNVSPEQGGAVGRGGTWEAITNPKFLIDPCSHHSQHRHHCLPHAAEPAHPHAS